MTRRCAERVRALGWAALVVCACLSVATAEPGTSSPSAVADAPLPYLISSWQVDDGLPQNSVNDILQTRDGYLWLATFNGLARFDGVHFTVFSTADTPALPANRIVKLHEDHLGRLWIGTEHGGLAVLEEGRFRAALAEDEAAGAIIIVSVTRDGSAWAASKNGRLIRIQDGRGTVVPLAEPVSRLAVAEAPEGGLWLITKSRRLLRWRDGQSLCVSCDWTLAGEKPHAVVWAPTLPLPQAASFDPTSGVGEGMGGGHGSLWLCTERELARWRAGRFEPVDLGVEDRSSLEFFAAARDGGLWLVVNGRLRCWRNGAWASDAGPWPLTTHGAMNMHEDRQGHLWECYFGGGLARVSPGGVTLRLTTREGLASDQVRAVHEDREGNVWVGYNGAGLQRLRPRVFEVLVAGDGPATPAALSVCEDREGTVWMGFNGGGLLRRRSGQRPMDLGAPASRRLVQSGDTAGKTRALPGTATLAQENLARFNLGLNNSPGYVWSVYEDRQGTVWAGTWDNGLFRFNGQSFVRAFPVAQVGQVLAMFEDRRGALWLGGSGALHCWHQGRLRTFNAQDGLANANVRAIAEDAGGDLWFGTAGGLHRLREERFTVFRQADGLAHDSVWALYLDGNGALWIGTGAGGLSRFQNGRFINFNVAEGLPNPAICHITEDGRGWLWCSSYGGILRAPKVELEAVARGDARPVRWDVFTRADGLPTRECSGGFQPSGCRTRDGRLWFPTAKGLVVVNPARLQINPLPPPVLVEEVVVDGEIVWRDGVESGPVRKWESGKVSDSGAGSTSHRPTFSPAIRLAPGRARVLEFRYTALSFTAPEKVRFKYQLQGLDRDWIDAGRNRVATYSFLPPGEYRFRVSACNNDGVWSKTGAALALTVQPFVWQTGWFQGTAALVGLLLLGGSVRFFEKRQMERRLERLRQQQAIERERTRIAQDLHDGLGASLTQISLLGALASQDAAEPAKVRQDLASIRATAREMVQALDEIVWAVDPAKDSAAELATYLCQWAQDFFRNSPIRCRLDVAEPLPAHPLTTEVRHNLFLGFKEALNNAARHSAASEVWVRVRVQGHSLHVRVEDNGQGFDPAAARGGHGLANMQARLQALGGRAQVRSQPSRGTSVTFRLPLRP